MNTADLFTVQQVAEMLGVNQNAVYIATSEGRLPFTEALGRKVIQRADIEAYKARTRVDGEKPKGRPKGSTKRKQQAEPLTNVGAKK